MEMTPAIGTLLDCAVSAVKAACSHALKNFSRRNEVVRVFKHDMKLVLDRECQVRATEAIRSAFPRHSIIGEEDVGDNQKPNDDSSYQWIIDPIDGTVNFTHGLPLWCSSVAVRHKEAVLAGAVYIPVLDELFTASVEQLSTMNGRPIHVSGITSVAASIMLTGLDKSLDPALPHFEVFRRTAASMQKTRVLGSAATDLCQVACGRAEAYYESGIYIWDVAAGGLIVERAGGKAEVLRHQDNGRLVFLATNGSVHSGVRDLIEGRNSTNLQA